MTTVEFLAYLRSLDIRLWAEGGRLRYDAPRGALTPALRQELVARKAELLAFFRDSAAVAHSHLPPIQPVPRDQPLPLSFVQERMWLAEQLLPGNRGGFGTGAIQMVGHLNRFALQQAINKIVQRHEILRTTFTSRRGEPVQVIAPELEVPLEMVDFSHLPEQEHATALRQLAAAETRQPFDLASGPLIRLKLVQLEEFKHILLITMHHIIFDGWSLGVLTRELATLYTAFVTGQPAALPSLPVQYADYAAWQRTWFQGEVVEKHLDYWQTQLSGDLPVLELPTDRPRPSVATFRGATMRFELPAALCAALRALSQSEGVTLFMTLLTAFEALLNRYSGQEDIVIGSPIARRTQVETEPLIGCFMSPLVLRTDLSGDPDLRSLLGRVREMCLAAYAHQDLPFELLVRALQPNPRLDIRHMPLFQVLFVLQNAPLEKMELPGLTLSHWLVDNESSVFDLSMYLWEMGSQVAGKIEYSTDLFDAPTIRDLLADYETVLWALVKRPAGHLSELPALRVEQRRSDARLAPSVDEGLRFSAGAKEQTAPNHLSGLNSARQELLALLLEEEKESHRLPDLIPHPGDRREFPLSFGQERLWFFDQWEPGHPVYNVSGALRLEGPLKVPALEKSLNKIVERHAVLRTTFHHNRGQPIQRIAPAFELVLPVVDLSDVPEPDRAAAVMRRAQAEAKQPFDLSRGPLLRATLLRLDAQSHVLVLTLHHIVCDGWSIGVFFKELMALYNAESAGMPLSLPALPFQYTDYALWQHACFRANAMTADLAYWMDQLRGPLPVLELPTDHPRPALQTYWGALYPFSVPSSVYEGLQTLSRSAGATLHMTLLAAFKTLLYRYTRQTDILVDTPIAGRVRPELEPLIGFFVNSLILRTDLSGNPSFQEYLQQVRSVCLAAYEHQNLPFEKLVEHLQPERDLSRTPLAQVSFMLHKTFLEKTTLADGVTLDLMTFDAGTAKFDLELYLWEGSAGLTGFFMYNTDLFESPTIERMTEHWQTLLEAIVADPQKRLSDLNILSDKEQQQLLVTWNKADVPFTTTECVHQLIETQAEKTPDAVAVEWVGQKLTYAELNTRANQVAHHLRSLGVGSEDRVGICAGRSFDMIAGMLGILKAGGAYVPLDPAYPPDRLAYMVEDAGIHVLVTQRSLLTSLPFPGLQIVCLEDVSVLGGAENPSLSIDPENLAYVMYTSGSTGRPKGVMIPHHALTWYAETAIQQYDLQPTDRVLQFTSVSFDISVEEIFPCLVRGATLVLNPAAMLDTPATFFANCSRWEITKLFMPTAYWHELVAGLATGGLTLPPSLQLLSFGGERALPERVKSWQDVADSPLCLMNTYGPTETTVVATLRDLTHWVQDEENTREVPIGRPIQNARVYVLDADLHPVPIGVPGELYIGGAGVGRGYLGRPDLTAERFVPDPFNEEPGRRMYRTGDWVRWLPDGDLEFLGRVDEQVKVRGYRIEPREIEMVLHQHPAVHEAVVLARENATGHKQLVAYVVLAAPAVPVRELQDYLRAQLPAYMVPTAFVCLDTLPLNANGKVDRAALPLPDEEALPKEAYVPPRTPTEQVLAGIFTQVLGLEKVGIHDNFFALGGHSLLATRLSFHIQEALGVELPLRRLFETPTIAQLAQAIEEAGLAELEEPVPALQPMPREDPVPLSFGQMGLWFVSQLQSEIPFSVPIAIRVTGRLGSQALEESLQTILQRHEALRTTFPLVEGRPVQVVKPPPSIAIPVIDLSHLPGHQQQDALMELYAREGLHAFDLTDVPLLRAALVRLHENEHVILVTMHHIVSDGWSTGVLIRELATAYQALVAGQPPSLPDLPVQYADYALWQRQWLQGARLETLCAYWENQLAGRPALLSLPTDFPRPSRPLPRGGVEALVLPEELTQSLRDLSQTEGATLFMTLLAALDVLLARYSSQQDIVVGTPVAGRVRPELEHLIGFFVNLLVLRTDLSGDPGFRELLQRVREVCLGAYTHQHLPFEILVERLQPARHLTHMPLFQVMFMLQKVPQQPMALGDLTWGAYVDPTSLETFVRSLQSRFDHVPAGHDLTLLMVETESQLMPVVHYRADLFKAETIRSMLIHYQTLLQSIVANPAQALSKLSILPPEEQQRLLVTWNGIQDSPEDSECIQRMFEAQVDRSPEAPAVVEGGETLTYRQLNQRANQLAHHLQSIGIGPEMRVGLCVERSMDMVVGLLGILKAGGTYVPLDPAYPSERLAFMIADAGISVLLTQQDLLSDLQQMETQPAATPLRWVCLDSDWPMIAQAGTENLTLRQDPESLAYIMYTSGSTGRPKGVMISHASLSAYVRTAIDQYALGPEDRVLQFTSVSFDISVEEIFPCLACGATLVLYDEWIPEVPAVFLRKCEQWQITKLFMPTAFWHEVTSAIDIQDAVLPSSLRLLCFGGERALPERAAAWRRRVGSAVRLMNTYGPTEATVVATLFELTQWYPSEPGLAEIPIGKPIRNAEVYVLDRHLQPVPVGVPGELYISGAGVGRGYLQDPALTALKFVPHPFSKTPGARLYRTGDLVRWLPDGNLAFVGRVDEQVKIRGYRVELSEIETVLGEHPAVQDAVVVARPDETGQNRLAAYIVSRPGQAPAIPELRRFLRAWLPAYMIPATFSFLDHLPMTPTGKVDRNALQEPDQGRPGLDTPLVAPRTPVETQLAAIWSDVLGISEVGVYDNFFELGGHSIHATQAVYRMQLVFEVDVPLRRLFETPTIADLAEYIEAARQGPHGLVNGPEGLDLEKEVVLDPALRPPSDGPMEVGSGPAHVLLTGATGFLGAFLLDALLQRTTATIHCLVRAGDVIQGMARLRKNLESYGLNPEMLDGRVIAVPGDLAQPLLGLAPEDFHALAATVDIIYHNGAWVNLLHSYATLKGANVLGTQEVLRLACTERTKPVHYVSTLSVLGTLEEGQPAMYLEEELRGSAGLHGGYAQSKWVAEKIVSLARDRGVPATIYRAGRITGHSRTGVCNPEDPVVRLFRGLIEMGKAPTIEPDIGLAVDLVPVDFAARAIVALSQQPASAGKIFHLVNPQPMAWHQFLDGIRSRGYEIQEVPVDQWVQEWQKMSSLSGGTPLFQDLHHVIDRVIQVHGSLQAVMAGMKVPQVDCQNLCAGLAGTDVICPLGVTLLPVYLDYFIRSGLLVAPPEIRRADDPVPRG